MNNKLKILMIGAGGGREHALGWKIAQSEKAGELFFARGNAGTAQLGTNLEIKEIDTIALIQFSHKEQIDLVLVVSDDPLALGAVDEFKKAGIRVWGPTKEAAKLEWSKAYSKNFMKRHKLPTAKFEVFTDFIEAKKYVERENLPIVIKASGLALGKGVVIASTTDEAITALENMMVKKIFGSSGEEVVIEEFMEGPEISIHAFCDGKNYKIFPASQDHKKIGDGDVGPNTGGIGVISPLPFVDEKLFKIIEDTIVAPTIAGLATDGIPFTGILYPGLMLTKDGPKLLEYNARFGDPEAEVYVRLLENDLLDIIDASIDGKLNEIEIKWKNVACCNIVLCSAGYPGDYAKGKEIFGIPPLLVEEGLGGGNSKEPPRPLGTPPQKGGEGDIVVFHAGTKIVRQGLTQKVVTSGGRVLGVSATADTLENALKKAYSTIKKISFEGMQYRKDVGIKALALKKS